MTNQYYGLDYGKISGATQVDDEGQWWYTHLGGSWIKSCLKSNSVKDMLYGSQIAPRNTIVDLVTNIDWTIDRRAKRFRLDR